jgi:threonylcarbamoyladenosine tRNA methylthiotransferase CDKAL1
LRPRRAYVAANGCPENRIDAATHGEFLRASGYEPAASLSEADLVFFSACGVTDACEEDSLRIVRVLKAGMQPTAELVVGGCLTRIDPRRLAEVFDGTTVPPDTPDALGALIGAPTGTPFPRPNAPLATCRLGRCANHNPHQSWLARLRKVTPSAFAERAFERLDRVRAHRSLSISDCPPGAYFIKVGTGCQNECAYCAVRLSRGRIVSMPPHEVMARFRQGLTRGYQQFVLLGTDQGSYGADIGTDLASLLSEMIQERGEYAIRIRNLEPMGLIAKFDRLRPIFASGRISLISSPVQTGSERLLRLMKRPYSIADFGECLRALRRDYPGILLRTQVMVGFPGETDDDFRATLGMLDELHFDYVEVYRFSPRPNTLAAAMPDQVPDGVKAARHRRLLAKVVFQQLTDRAPLRGLRAARCTARP